MLLRRLTCLVCLCALPTFADFTWSVSKLADPWVVSGWLPAGKHCLNLVINPSAPATHVGVLSSTLVEQNTKKPLPASKLLFCRGLNGCDTSQPADLPKGPNDVSLCLAPDFLTHGSFQGAVFLSAAEKPDGEQVLKGVQVSSAVMKLTGFMIILIGVWVAWASKVWARARLDRDSALQPVALLRQNLDRLRDRLSALENGLTALAINTATTIGTLQEEITDQSLDSKHLLPPRFPNPFGAPSFDLVALKVALDKVSADEQTIAVLVRSMDTVAAMDESKIPGGHEAVEAAITAIDKLAASATLPTSDVAQTQATKIIDGLRPVAQNAFVQNAVQLGVGQPSEPDRLQIDVERVVGFVWLIWGGLTALTGLAALILSNPGFGTPIDLLYCFFWGFALPAVGQQLTPGSAGASLGISIGKTT